MFLYFFCIVRFKKYEQGMAEVAWSRQFSIEINKVALSLGVARRVNEELEGGYILKLEFQ